MYSDWVHFPATQTAKENCVSVLQKFSYATGRDIVSAVLKCLALDNYIKTGMYESSTLVTETEVNWCMEVICFGLQLPLTEHDSIRECVNVYCEWLQALTTPKVCVPKPVQEDPNHYCRKILRHLYNLFVPRDDGTTSDTIGRQAVLCHRVLRTLQMIAQESTVMEKSTWDELLLLLLAVNDTLLSPPSRKDDIGSNLCERIITALFEVWLVACHRCFPSPPLWKTFREMCCSWRHRGALVDQWNRITIVLTSRILHFMYGSLFPEIKVDDDGHVLPTEISSENVAQSWYRFLHILGNPIDLCRPEIVSQTPGFYSYTDNTEMIVDPYQSPCLAALPQIFYKAMSGIATLVDAFLGICHPHTEEETLKATVSSSISVVSTTPPHQRKSRASTVAANLKGIQKSGLIAGITGHRSSSVTSHSSQQQHVHPSQPSTPTNPVPVFRPTPAVSRPRCNSILHLFGSWLFEAALVGSELDTHYAKSASNSDGDSIHSRTSMLESSSRPNSLPGMPDSFEFSSPLTSESFESGQAEAVGALCRLFCSKKTGEEILPVYLSRFYLSLKYILSNIETKSQVVASILLNSCELFRQDMEGVNILVPYFLNALEYLFTSDKESKIKMLSNVSQVELRWSSIHLLLSMLPLPLHYGNLQVKDFDSGQSLTFYSIRSRLINLLIGALQSETDSVNTQMLLGGLLSCVQDATTFEEANEVMQPQAQEAQSSGSPKPSRVKSDMDWTQQTGGLDSAYSLFVRATYLTCHRLISSWKTDMHVSLAALEVLSGLARIHLPQQDCLECRRVVKWICDYIVYQCQRPPPAHSKDLHSTIVAAFQCVVIWLIEHPDLMQDKDCVHHVLEVIELGISGSKSQPKASYIPKLKHEKELKPASMRVRDAAEAVLSCIMDHVGFFPNLAGPESTSSLLDEESLLKFSNVALADASLTREVASKHFRYFITETSAVLAFLEQSLGNDQDAHPTVTLLIRIPFGRFAWTMQLRHLPRHKSGPKGHAASPGRPIPLRSIARPHYPKPRCFPDMHGDIPVCRIDKSIPDCSSVVSKEDHNQLVSLLEQQAAQEHNVVESWRYKIEHECPDPKTECKAPTVCQEFQTARLFLTHLGFFTQENLEDPSGNPSLMALSQNDTGFIKSLESLDQMSSRTNDTVYVFYVKAGQTTPAQILNNVTSSKTVHPQFLEFLRTLGWPVDVAKHAGWTGSVSTSWKLMSGDFNIVDLPSDHGGSLYSGHHQVLYWSDVLSEVAFIVPSPKSIIEDNLKDEQRSKAESCSEKSSVSSLNDEQEDLTEKPRALSLNLDSDGSVKTGSNRRYTRSGLSSISSGEVKVMVAWLESYEDHLTFPIADLLQATNTDSELSAATSKHPEKDTFVIFIHALQSGLFRIKIHGRTSAFAHTIPLIDGMVVSRRVLGILVRHTALNFCRRRRLEMENCFLPHVRRRQKIQEMANKFQMKQSNPDMFNNLFSKLPSE